MNQVMPKEWQGRAEIARADLLTSPALEDLFDNVDVLIHLAATMNGTASEQRTNTTVSTKRLLNAMQTAGSTHHVVLASSASVYNFTESKKILNEESPLEAELGNRDGYAISKILQERITRDIAKKNRWELAVLRPGFIYGSGTYPAACAGLRLGQMLLVISPLANLRLTHVDNCAEAFVEAAGKKIAGTFNIIDDGRVSAWHYARRLNYKNNAGLRVPVPYLAGLSLACLASIISPFLASWSNKKLPSILNHYEYRARFKPFEYDNHLAKEVLGWKCQSLFETGAT